MVLGFTPLNAVLLLKLNGKSTIAGSLTSYLTSILFNWGGEIHFFVSSQDLLLNLILVLFRLLHVCVDIRLTGVYSVARIKD